MVALVNEDQAKFFDVDNDRFSSVLTMTEEDSGGGVEGSSTSSSDELSELFFDEPFLATSTSDQSKTLQLSHLYKSASRLSTKRIYNNWPIVSRFISSSASFTFVDYIELHFIILIIYIQIIFNYYLVRFRTKIIWMTLCKGILKLMNHCESIRELSLSYSLLSDELLRALSGDETHHLETIRVEAHPEAKPSGNVSSETWFNFASHLPDLNLVL